MQCGAEDCILEEGVEILVEEDCVVSRHGERVCCCGARVLCARLIYGPESVDFLSFECALYVCFVFIKGEVYALYERFFSMIFFVDAEFVV